MEHFHAVGVGALNRDIKFKIKLEDLVSCNKELETNGLELFFLGEQSFDKQENFEPTLEIVKKYAGKPIEETVGGSATLTMIALSWMRFRTGYFGLTGFDTYKFLENSLRREGVDPMLFVGGLGCGECISVSDGKDRGLKIYPRSNDLLGHRHLTNSSMKNLSLYKIIHMSSFACSLGYEPLEVQTKIAEEFGEEGRISFAPDELYTKLGLKMLEPILKNSHVVFLSRSNMQTLTDEDYREGSEKLSGYRIRYIVTTLGDKGAHLRYNGDEFLVEPIKIPESEIKHEGFTGAGDFFAAGFLAGLLKGKSPKECMYLGSKVASMRLQGLEREAYQNIEI